MCVVLARLTFLFSVTTSVFWVGLFSFSGMDTMSRTMEPVPENFCPTCGLNVLRRSEQHVECFDCLDHGPQDMGDLRCLICRTWEPRHFVKATAKYDASSQARRLALELDAAASTRPLFQVLSPPPPPAPSPLPMDFQESVGRVEVPVGGSWMDPSFSLPSPPPPPPPPPPGLSLTAAMIKDNIIAVMQEFGFSLPSAGTVPSAGSGEMRQTPVASGAKRKKKTPVSSTVVGDSLGSIPVPVGPPPVGTQQPLSLPARAPLDCELPPVWQSLDRGTAGSRPRVEQDVGDSVSQSHSHGLLRAARKAPSTLPSRAVPGRWEPSVSAYSLPSLSAGSAATRESLGSTASRSRDDREDADAALPDSDSDSEQQGGARSNFRWAVEQVAELLCLPVPPVAPSLGFGRFAVTPSKQLVQLPLAFSSVNAIAAVNELLSAKKQVSKDPIFPSWRPSAHQLAMYASAPTAGVRSAMPVVDEFTGLLPKRKSAVWSAPVKKQRLAAWQGLSHQLVGQLSSADHFLKLSQEMIDDFDLPVEQRVRVQAALGVLDTTVASAQKSAVILTSHLDITAREAELRLLDVTEIDEAELRARPLFEGHVFANPSKASVVDYRHAKRDEALFQVTSKAVANTKTPKKTKAKAPTGVTSTSALPQAPPPFRPTAPPRAEGRGRGRRAKSSRGKAKS